MPRKMIASAFLAFVGFYVALAFNSTCYGPPYDGGGPEGLVYPGDTPCSQSTDDDKARVRCGYSDGSICLSNGLCFVPQNNTMMQGSCTDPTWGSPDCPNTGRVDSNLHICDSTAGDVPAPGDAGGLWYCGTQTQACNTSVRTFGIEQGFFADFRNFSSSSSAAAKPTKSTTSVPSGGVTTSVDSNTSAATGTRATEASCPSHTGSEITQPTQRLNTLSDGAIAGIAIGGVFIALIFFGLGVFVSQRRKGRINETVQPNMGDNPLTRYWKTGRDPIRRPSVQSPVRELDGDYPRVELS